MPARREPEEGRSGGKRSGARSQGPGGSGAGTPLFRGDAVLRRAPFVHARRCPSSSRRGGRFWSSPRSWRPRPSARSARCTCCWAGSADVGSRPEPRRDGRAPSAWRSRGYAAGVSFGAAPARLWSGRQWATSRAITARGAGNLRAARKKHLPVWLTAAGPYGRCMPETHVAAPQWAKPFARSRYTGCRAREAARESLARVAARTCKFGPPGAHQAGDDPAARELPA